MKSSYNRVILEPRRQGKSALIANLVKAHLEAGGTVEKVDGVTFLIPPKSE